MRTKLRSCVLAVACLVCPAFGLAMNNDDVVKMVNAQLGEDTIVTSVQSAKPAEFDTGADALIALKKKGVSEKIIQAMIRTQQPGAEKTTEGAGQQPRITYKDVPDGAVLPPVIAPVAGREYFTRYTLRFEKDERPATNYWRGELVPINSKVVLEKIAGNKIALKLLNANRSLTIVNIPNYTKKTADQLAAELLADQPVAIEKYGDAMAGAIKTGTVRLGMTKTQVLLTRGYPPAHETPSLDGGNWKYWSSRFVTQTLVFNGNILTEGRGLD